MFDSSRDCTSVEKGVLTRLIAAALVNETVAWLDAETQAENEVASLWGRRTPDEHRLPVKVTTRMLVQLAAAADTAVSTRHGYGAGSGWTVQVGRDLAEIRKLIGAVEP
ncbi:hypothetical protein Caci_4841 [Catenulispora acidiphila DSM 44928]|uniref:Uncharacterized protein n=1 Tax=Catenulispora acidiphila (strain DSM 44928 / JCM 14897 / NBRC 102108 / NRRL B-24433 / ID139908) TaxID=479433 RepID=C7Q1H3_CATAD|nr:hypothetical protein [Catenulispora acidiphila]ACU73702.1 hypothetical protein Caci_4841 [Catenulispora acidiphila DSM 44928]